MKTLAWALLAVAATSCEKSKTAPTQEVKKGKERPDTAGKAEVEFFGQWSAGEVKAAKYVFVAQAEPCVPVPEKATRFGELNLEKQGPLFAEFFIPQGTVGHACVYGLDEAGKVVSAANSTQNPMRFNGDGEVIFGKLDYALAP